MTKPFKTRRTICQTDLYADDVILDPHPVYRQMRDTGPAVWLPKMTSGRSMCLDW